MPWERTMSETLLLSYQCNISWFIWYHQLWFLNFYTVQHICSSSAFAICVSSTQSRRNSTAEIRNFPRHLSHVTQMPLVTPKVTLPCRILEPAEVLCFSLHSETSRCEDGRVIALWKSREPLPPTEGHRRTRLEALQNSTLGRKGQFPFSAGYSGCFPTAKPEVPACIQHLFTGYPSLPSLPSHTQTRSLKITNEPIHFYLETWP